MNGRRRPGWKPEHVRKLCDEYLSVSVEVAADVLGMSRASAYGAIKRGTFPATVIKPSQRGWFVITASLLRVVELNEGQAS